MPKATTIKPAPARVFRLGWRPTDRSGKMSVATASGARPAARQRGGTTPRPDHPRTKSGREHTDTSVACVVPVPPGAIANVRQTDAAQVRSLAQRRSADAGGPGLQVVRLQSRAGRGWSGRGTRPRRRRKGSCSPDSEVYLQMGRMERGAELFDPLSGWVQGLDARSAQDSLL